MIHAIDDRRSIRKFLDTSVPRDVIEEILQSGMKAPSSKNRQPWKFIVVQGEEKERMLRAFRQGLEREEKREAFLPQSRPYIGGAKYTLEIMAQAPVSVFVVNMLGKDLMTELTTEERVSEICNIQSIGASIQNMLLAATEKGIGSLWICDIYFAYPELCEWLHSDGQLVAAVAFGYPNEQPGKRPRKAWEETVEWRCTGVKDW